MWAHIKLALDGLSVKHAFDGISIVVAFGALWGDIPTIASLMSIVYLGVQFFLLIKRALEKKK